MRRFFITTLFCVLLGPAPSHAATCEITFALQDEIAFSTLALNVDYSRAPGVFFGIDVAECQSLVNASISQFPLNSGLSTLGAGFVSLSGIAGPPYPLPLMRCRYSGAVPLATDFTVRVNDAAGTAFPFPPIVPLPTVAISSISCIEDGCLDDLDCNDGDECTQDICNTGTGVCSSATVTDGTACTGGVCCAGQCVSAQSCDVHGDCNGTRSLDAGDPVCSVLCLIGAPPAVSDCQVGADCNCTGGLDAGDPVCTVLRLIGGLSSDPCLP